MHKLMKTPFYWIPVYIDTSIHTESLQQYRRQLMYVNQLWHAHLYIHIGLKYYDLVFWHVTFYTQVSPSHNLIQNS